MNAKEMIRRAISCDQDDRLLEAQQLYQDGIEMLMDAVAGESDCAKKKIFYERIKEYIDRAEHIKDRLQKYSTGARLIANVPIDEDSVGHSYNKLFGSYLGARVREALIEEPYLQDNYQIQDLVMFLELLVKNCHNLKYIRIVTKTNTKPSDQLKNFEQIKMDLLKRGITVIYKFDEALHDRKISLSNGYIFKIGRGLHIYKPTNPMYSLGLYDFDFRKCRQTDVDILYSQNTPE